MSTLKRNDHRNKKMLFWSICISIIMLLSFMYFQHTGMIFLNLDIKWLIVCGIPILLALLIGGYIKTFKGFGMELETELKEPIPIELISKVDFLHSPSFTKSTIRVLNELSNKEKNSIKRLTFVWGKIDYYEANAIEFHLRELKYLQFIEIVNEYNQFLYLIPINGLLIERQRGDDVINYEKINNFIDAIENKNIYFFSNIISDHVFTSDNIIEVYKKLVFSSQSKSIPRMNIALPILDEKKHMVGLVLLHKVESKIAEEVARNI